MADRFVGRTFENVTLIIDNSIYEACKFVRCNLVYNGFAGVGFDNCLFTDCTWQFHGPAANVLAFLGALYNKLGAENLVEGIFETIRAGHLAEKEHLEVA
jgi:hypothetical protein